MLRVTKLKKEMLREALKELKSKFIKTKISKECRERSEFINHQLKKEKTKY